MNLETRFGFMCCCTLFGVYLQDFNACSAHAQLNIDLLKRKRLFFITDSNTFRILFKATLTLTSKLDKIVFLF